MPYVPPSIARIPEARATPMELQEQGIFLTGKKHIKNFELGPLLFFGIDRILMLSAQKTNQVDYGLIEKDVIRAICIFSSLLFKYEDEEYKTNIQALQKERKTNIAKINRSTTNDEMKRFFFTEEDIAYSTALFREITLLLARQKLFPTEEAVMIDGYLSNSKEE